MSIFLQLSSRLTFFPHLSLILRQNNSPSTLYFFQEKHQKPKSPKLLNSINSYTNIWSFNLYALLSPHFSLHSSDNNHFKCFSSPSRSTFRLLLLLQTYLLCNALTNPFCYWLRKTQRWLIFVHALQLASICVVHLDLLFLAYSYYPLHH